MNKIFAFQHTLHIATLFMGGTTIHSLLGLFINKNVIVNKSNSIIDIRPTTIFIIIDDILMVGCNMFITTHLKLQKN
jgi:hypothetical protein